MPRANFSERLVRNRRIFAMSVAGESLGRIAAHPQVQLSLRGVQLVVRRERVQLDVAEWLSDEYDAACRAARAGDASAARRCRMIAARLSCRR